MNMPIIQLIIKYYSDVSHTQVASRALGIGIEKIHVSETSTNAVPNATTTSASLSSDVNGMAIMVCPRPSSFIRWFVFIIIWQ